MKPRFADPKPVTASIGSDLLFAISGLLLGAVVVAAIAGYGAVFG